MSTTDILRAQLREVAQRRADRDALAARLRDVRAAFEATLGDLPARVKGASEAVILSEDAAKRLAEAMRASTGEKKPLEGVAVQDRNVYTYDKGEAFTWAKKTGVALIPESLDVAAFEAIAKATPLPFVTHRLEGAATLAKDLSAYLAPTPSDASPLTGEQLERLPF